MRNEVFKMVALVILCFLIGAILVSLGAFYLYLDHMFKHQKEQLGKTLATRRAVTIKKNAQFSRGARSYRTYTVKDYRRGRYEYSVNGRSYRLRVEAYNNPEKLRPVLPVTYWKRFPRIACAETALSFCRFVIYAVICFVIAGFSVGLGLLLLLLL